MNSLIFDRTMADVEQANAKGQYNASDLNRVEEWCEYLATELTSLSYPISITTKTNWVQSDMRYVSDMNRIKNNINAIMNGYTYITNLNPNISSFDYIKANNWEKILYEIDTMLKAMQNYMVFSGVASSGQKRFWQNRFRSNIKKVEYLESTGTQYIDTGVIPQNTQDYDLKYSLNNITDNMVVLGSRSSGTYSSSLNQVYINFNKNQETQNIYQGVLYLGTQKNLLGAVQKDTIYTKNFNYIEYSGNFNNNASKPFFLCALNNVGNPAAYFKGKIYSCKIHNNGALIRDFIPALDNNNVACLFDKVTNTFFYNKGTGDFIVPNN